jgi:hypothetical protein
MRSRVCRPRSQARDAVARRAVDGGEVTADQYLAVGLYDHGEYISVRANSTRQKGRIETSVRVKARDVPACLAPAWLKVPPTRNLPSVCGATAKHRSPQTRRRRAGLKLKSMSPAAARRRLEASVTNTGRENS